MENLDSLFPEKVPKRKNNINEKVKLFEVSTKVKDKYTKFSNNRED